MKCVLLLMYALTVSSYAYPLEGRWLFRTYATADGLRNPFVSCLKQDATGFLWIGTEDGLYRFDGKHFVRFGKAEGLPDDSITCLHETADGRLYIGTRAGLARKNGDRFMALLENSGLPASTIPYAGIASDSKGTVFVGTRRGLYVGYDDVFRLEPRKDGGQESTAFGLHVDRSDTLFFAREKLFRRSNGVTKEFGSRYGLATGEWMDATLTDREGRLWVRTLRSLYVLRPGASRFEKDDEGLPSASQSGRLSLDDHGALLVPTIRGLARKDELTGKWRIIGFREGLDQETVTSALVDREGSLFVGLLRGGVAQRIGTGAFTWFGRREGLSNDTVHAVRRSNYGDPNVLWVGTDQGLNQIHPDGSVSVLTKENGLAASDVSALVESTDGKIWVGSWSGGVTCLGPQPGQFQIFSASGLALDQFHVLTLHAAANGDVWAGAWSGAYVLRRGSSKFEHIEVPKSQEPDYVNTFAEDARGTIWCGGASGMTRLSGPDPRHFNKNDGLQANEILGITVSPDQSFLISYESPHYGIDRVVVRNDSLDVHPIFRKSPPRTSYVLGIDGRQSAWIVADSNLVVLDTHGKERARFGEGDGIPGNTVLPYIFLADPDGTVWLGDRRGLVRFQSGVKQPAPRSPPVVILSVLANGKPLIGNSIERLPHNFRDISISWAALTFVNPDAVRYQYRLTGFDPRVIETPISETRYAALPHGKYDFEVIAISAAGLASAMPAHFSFEVLPAWWETWTARAFAVVLLMSAIAGIISLRTRSLKLERAKLEAAVAERSAALAEANRELREISFTDPLTGIRNRRYFQTIIHEEVSRVLRIHSRGEQVKNRDLVFYIVDVDHFKDVNDQFGHEAGDRVLTEIARRLGCAIRDSDLLIRWGGEEFLVASRDTNRQDGAILAQRLLNVVGSAPIEISDGKNLIRTCSIGWAALPFSPQTPTAFSAEDVLSLADRALYFAKENGRNNGIGILAEEIPINRQRILEEPLEKLHANVLTLVRSCGPSRVFKP